MNVSRYLRSYIRHHYLAAAKPGSYRVADFSCKAVYWLLLCWARICAPRRSQPLILQRGNGTVVIGLYAPNIVRITLGVDKAQTTAASGYGFIGTPFMKGWITVRDNRV